jgi:hypothetical protein
MTTYKFRAWAGPSFVKQLTEKFRDSAVVRDVFAGTEHVHFTIAATNEDEARKLAAVPCSALSLGTPELLGEA